MVKCSVHKENIFVIFYLIKSVVHYDDLRDNSVYFYSE